MVNTKCVGYKSMLGMPLLKEKITEKLREQILEMRSNNLIKIPSERLLAENLSVSRPSIRAAIKTLTAEGLLIQEQGKGTYITPKVKIHTLDISCSPDIKKNDPFYNSFLVEITSFAAKQSIQLCVLDFEQIKCAVRDVPLLIVGRIDDNILDKLSTIYKTIIAFQSYPHRNDFMQLFFDHYKIGFVAAKTLIEYNHKNIVHLAGPDKYASALNRKVGFIDAIKDTDAKYSVLTGKMNWSGGYNAGDFIVNEYTAEDRPTAVFVANDWMAVGLMQSLKEKGLKIPEDISIIGCDNIPLANDIAPSLTTFSLDMKYLIGELFVVLSQIGNPDFISSKKVMLPATLIYRESLKKLERR